MLGIGFASLLGGAGGVLFLWKIALPFSRVLRFSEEHNQERCLETESLERSRGHYAPKHPYLGSPTDLGMTKAIVKLSTAVKATAHDHAVAR